MVDVERLKQDRVESRHWHVANKGRFGEGAATPTTGPAPE